MKLWECLKIHEETGRKIRPNNRCAYSEPYEFFGTAGIKTIQEYFNCDWEVEPAKVSVTREQVLDGVNRALAKTLNSNYIGDEICKELGL